MTNVMKKLSALILTLALLFTMMPVLSLGAYAAEDDVLSVTVNGVEAGTVTSAWVEENMEEPQIFPFVTSKGNKWGYMIAEGPSYEALLMKALGVEDLSEYEEGDLVWTASDGVQDNPNNVLEVSELLGAKEQIGFEDQNGNVITGGFGSNYPDIKTVTAVKVPGAEGVTPILGTAQSKGTYPTYEKAAEALADGSWRTEATSEIRAYIGGNTSYKAVVKENGGAVDMSSPNITGKYSIGNVVSLDVRMPADVLSVTVNGASAGAITDKWIAKNMEEPQIFPFVTSKGNKWGYMIAEGPSYEALLMKALGVEDLSDYEEGELVWTASDGVQDNPNNVLKVSELLGAKEQIGFEDQDGNVITGGFGSNYPDIKTVTAVKVPGAEGVTPILGTAQSKGTYATYEEAAAALADGSWKTEATSEIRAYIGGNTGYKAVVKKPDKENVGVVDMSSPNITGKYSIGNVVSLDVRFVPQVFKTSMTFTNKTAQTATVKYSDSFIEKFGGLTWKTSNSKIATVDKNGKVTPTGVGNCTVTATLGSGDIVVEIAVTVKAEAFPQEKAEPIKKPAAPKSFKVKNVKKKSAKLTWKKVSGASGYVIYRSTKKNKGFKKIKTITKAKTVKYTNKKLKKGKTYYFKIRAYKKVNGKKVYSKYTSVKKVKIKK